MKKMIGFAMIMALGLIMVGCKSESKTVNNADDIKGAKVGVQQGTTGHLYLDDNHKDDGTTIEAFNKYGDAVAALKNGQVDCVVIDNDTANSFLKQNDDLKIVGEPLEEEVYAICVAKDNKELLDKINKALDELDKDGTSKKIKDNYIGDDPQKLPYEKDPNNKGENGKLIMATNAQFAPYEYHDENKIVGIDPDMAQAIADKLGMELAIEDMDFDGIIASVTSKKANMGMAGMSVTDERKKSVDFSNPYVNSKLVILVRK